jgi:hypothetical protein
MYKFRLFRQAASAATCRIMNRNDRDGVRNNRDRYPDDASRSCRLDERARRGRAQAGDWTTA